MNRLASAVLGVRVSQVIRFYDQKPLYHSYKYRVTECSCVMCLRVNTVAFAVLYLFRLVQKKTRLSACDVYAECQANGRQYKLIYAQIESYNLVDSQGYVCKDSL
jgi:hypothetical protein